jgi:hypothetical protein
MEGHTEIRRFSDNDIRFLIETVDPQLLSRVEIMKDDASIVEGMLANEPARLFDRIMSMTEETMMTISPRFLFEVLLRRAGHELKNQSYTVERTATQRIPVFDAREVSRFLEDRSIIVYLADLLASFTKVQSLTLRSRIRKGIWRRVRFSDMDVDSLVQLCGAADEGQRFGFYKRIADLCLFILGIFPEYAGLGATYRSGSEPKPRFSRRLGRSAEDYEQQGRLFYKLAGQHRSAKALELDQTLYKLHEKFTIAKKPLNYISDNYLKFRKGELFPTRPG